MYLFYWSCPCSQFTNSAIHVHLICCFDCISWLLACWRSISWSWIIRLIFNAPFLVTVQYSIWRETLRQKFSPIKLLVSSNVWEKSRFDEMVRLNLKFPLYDIFRVFMCLCSWSSFLKMMFFQTFESLVLHFVFPVMMTLYLFFCGSRPCCISW